MAEKRIRRRINTEALLQNAFYGKAPPQSLEIETAILGTILQFSTEQYCKKVMMSLIPEHMYDNKHQLLVEAILHLQAKDSPIDILTVTEQCRFSGSLEKVGGPYYITTLTNSVSSATNIDYHFKILYQYFVRRKIIECSQLIMASAFEDTKDMFDLLDQYIEQLESVKISKTFKSNRKAVTVAEEFILEVCNQATAKENPMRWVAKHDTGHPRFDQTVTISRDKIILLAGGAKHGKSKLVSHFMFELLERHKDVAIFWVSLEDSEKDILRCYLSSKVLIKPKWIREQQFPTTLKPLLKEWTEVFKTFDIEFRDQTISSFDIVNQFSQFCAEREGKFPILVVDNVMSLKDREKYQHDLNGMYDYVMHNMLICRQKTHGLIWVLHHYNDAQQDEKGLAKGYRPRLQDIKGTEAFRRVPNQVLMINNPGKYKDLMNQYQGDRKDLLKYLFIIDAGANREDNDSDDVALIHYFCTLDFTLFKEIEVQTTMPINLNPDELQSQIED